MDQEPKPIVSLAEAMEACRVLLAGLNHTDAPILREKEANLKDLKDKNCLFFGLPRSKELRRFFDAAPSEVSLAPDKISVKGFSDADCLFLAFQDSKRNGKMTALFLPVSGTGQESVVMAARKITHYGKYSYLAFSSGTIQAKGVWEISRSPMVIVFNDTN